MNPTPLTNFQIADLERILGHALSPAELAHYNPYHSDEYGYFLMDSQPRGDRKLLLLFSGCWGRGILHYLRNYRQDLLSIYSPLVIIDYSLVIHVMRDKKFPCPEIVKDAWATADAVIFSPIGASYGDFSSEYLLRFVKPECKVAQFTMAHQSCWWPVAPILGEHGAHYLMQQGLTDDQIWQKFLDGSFEPFFEMRYAEQRAWTGGKQSFGSIRITDFIDRNFRKQKLFFTFNHPTYYITAFCAESAFALLGHEMRSEEYLLSLPIDAYMVGDIWPETHYEWDYYKFTYPLRYPHTQGGWEAFYKKAIVDSRTRWENRDSLSLFLIRLKAAEGSS